MIKKIKGIVIKTKHLQEADKLVTILSSSQGIVSFIFKGVVKSKSRKLNTADIGTAIALTYRRKNIEAPAYAQEVKLINPFKNVKEGYDKFLYLNYIVELFFYLSDREDTKILYNFLYNILLLLNEGNPGEILLRYIEFRLVKLNGILPDLGFCSVCNRELNKTSVFYDVENNITVCSQCANKNCRQLNEGAVNTIGKFERSSLKTVENIDTTSNCIAELRDFFHQVIVSYLNKDLKSYSVINSLL